MKYEFAESGDVYLCDVEEVLVCLFEDVANSGVVCNELEWNIKEGGAEILIYVIGSARGKERELTSERCVL